MKVRIAACSCMLLFAGSAAAAEAAFTVRPTELKDKPFTDAATLLTLAEARRVDVLQRQASWMQVKAERTTGWVKMLSLRFDQAGATRSNVKSSSNLSVLFNVAQTGKGGSTATTGVKGITEEALRNPKPNPVAIGQMNELAVSREDVQAFGMEGQLVPQKLAYAGARK